MAQKYKVYFANRPVVFTAMEELPATSIGHESFVSQGKMDTALIENAISRGAKSIHIRCADLMDSWSAFCDQFTLIRAAGGVVNNSAGEVLFIYRLDKWDLPKGKVEKREAIEEAAVREVEEECSIGNLHLKEHLITTYHTYMQDAIPILKSTDWFLMHYAGAEQPMPQLIEGITKVEWMHPQQWSVVKKNTYPSVLDVLAVYAAQQGA
jgi:ADP-ribose pyrophosphatase YjhB (NUDIX family)